jgi:hypothetical protein
MVDTGQSDLKLKVGLKQLGLGVKNGAEAVAHVMRTLLGDSESEAQDPLMAIDADVKDAYFAPCRLHTWRLLEKYFPGWLRYFAVAWHGASTLRSGAYTIEVVSGFWIGINDAGFLFVLNLLEILNELANSGLAHTLMSFIDNLYIVCRRSRGPQLVSELVRLLGEARLELRQPVKGPFRGRWRIPAASWLLASVPCGP